MDPSIMKLLEEDEDETIHSGAEVEAFTAALNRDIEGDTSTSKPSDSETDLPHNGNPTSSQLFPQWQTSNQEENNTCQNQQEEPRNLQPQEQCKSESDPMQHGSSANEQSSQERAQLPLQQKQSTDQQQEEQNSPQFSQKGGVQLSEQNPVHFSEQDRMLHTDTQHPQYPKLQKTNNQQALPADLANNPMSRSKQVPFGLLLPVILPHLDKDRAMQLQTLFAKLRKNEINKEGFIRLMRSIVGDHMLKQAVSKHVLHQELSKTQAAQNPQTGSHQFQLQSQASSHHQQQHHHQPQPQSQTQPQPQTQPQQQQQQLKMPSLTTSQFTDPHSFSQLQQKSQKSPTDLSQVPTSTVQIQADSNFLTTENSTQRSRDTESQSDSQGTHVSKMSSANMSMVKQERELPTISVQGLNKQQQQHLHLPQTSFTMYGGTVGNYHSSHAYSGPPISGAATSLKSQTQDSQMRQVPLHQSMVSTQIGGATQPVNMMSVAKYEMQNSPNEPKRLPTGPLSHLSSHSTLQQNPVPWHSAIKEHKIGAPSSIPYIKQEQAEKTAEQPHKSQLSAPQGSSSFATIQAEQEEITDKPSARMSFSTSTSMVPTNLVSSTMSAQLESTMPMRSQIPSTATPVGVGPNMKTPPKKSSVGQKKPLESLGSPTPPSSKKQKVSGAFLDQSIEQLNDVTAVSGVNLREEEEQLFSGSKEESRASEATRRVVQEEEERLILQKIPLQKKLAQIMSKCGIKNINNDVERCLSLSVEERMRGLISNLIRLSKQRVDIEKPRHRTVITSDIQRQILLINRKAKEEWNKKLAEEAEKLRKLNEAEGNSGADGDKDKDEVRLKAQKSSKEEDDKMRTTAANVAARAAVGGDDMLSKWQLMAEQARQKREGGIDMASGVLLGKDLSRRPLSTSSRITKDSQKAENKGPTAGAASSGPVGKFGRSHVVVSQTKVSPTISVKDVIAVLEREPQMSRSTLIYRLYEKMHSDAVATDRR
ncbi:PREDICTED: transcription initiation factor TFIID subunit 4b isoform X3 [Nelumbo nucifera]|uniref:Transcription initiation factor TFIID subunit 4b isoform X3 n=1 Tax=Nelumbo nucifera TaxID=4432 RepID=A0A1U8AZD2_NELNU|nr:PREDICTED: transcription initiation factor TFIID subunit 4b isoform X3 [Nelumbo nucifera]